MPANLDLAAPKTATNEQGAPLDDEKSGNSNKIIFIMLPVLLLVAVGAGLHFSGKLDSMLGKDSAEESTSHGENTDDETGTDYSKIGEISNIAFLPIPDMIVNLSNDGSGQAHLLRLSVQLELANEQDKDRKSTRLNSSHDQISYAVFCLKKKTHTEECTP